MSSIQFSIDFPSREERRAKSEDLYISIIKQLPSIIVMSNMSSFDNSQKEYLFQQKATWLIPVNKVIYISL